MSECPCELGVVRESCQSVPCELGVVRESCQSVPVTQVWLGSHVRVSL